MNWLLGTLLAIYLIGLLAIGTLTAFVTIVGSHQLRYSLSYTLVRIILWPWPVAEATIETWRER